MKKNYFTLLIILAFIGFNAFGQNVVTNGDFENWTGGAADNWLADGGAIAITQNSTTTQSGASSCEVMWTSQDNQYLTSDPFTVTAGIEFNASMWVYDNEIAGRARLCIIYEGTDNYYGDYSTDMDSWQELTYSDVVPSGVTTAQFQIRFYDISGDWDGDATVIVDNVVFENNTTVNPEPTNYPTDFSANPEGTKIVTSWTDATGDQLPFAYLLLGTNDGSTLPVPVDGTPVADDLDWSDGQIAVAVYFGTEMFSVSADPSTEYNFIIYPYSNTGENIDYKTDGTAPTASAVSNSSSTVYLETFDTDLGTTSGFSVTGDQVWVWDSYGLPPGCAKMNGYSEGAVENEDWLVTPAINLSNYDTVMLSFDHARNFASNDGLYVLVSSDYDGSGDPSTNGTWDDLSSMFTFPDPGSWVFIPAGKADVTMYAGATTYFAFKYTSTSSDASTWEIDNVLVYGEMGVGVVENEVAEISIYPNPASGFVNLSLNSDGEISLVNIAGQTVYNQKVTTGTTTINTSQLPKGLYFARFIGDNQVTETVKLLLK